MKPTKQDELDRARRIKRGHDTVALSIHRKFNLKFLVEILRAIHKTPMTSEDLAEHFDCSLSTIRRILQAGRSQAGIKCAYSHQRRGILISDYGIFDKDKLDLPQPYFLYRRLQK